MTNRFKVFIPFYNVEKWIKKTIRSVKRQNYKNFECILVDDIAQQEIENDNRFRLIKNTEKKFVLKNLCDAIKDFAPDEEDIIVVVDGDDWLAKADVLSYLNNVYESQGCWLTYGSYMEYPSNTRGKFASKVPEYVINNNLFRNSAWMTSHLRTWKYGLWKNIDQARSFIEPDVVDEDNHFANCWDLAYMFPLLELAGTHIRYIPDILYVYNRQNPLNVDKLDHNLQLIMEQKIRNMKKYNPLNAI
jgi:glycosyltransferase involved in cell wall biosynthesis